MVNSISKILDAIFVRVAFDITKNKINYSFRDHIALEILRNDQTMAYQALSIRLSSSDLAQIPTQIEEIVNSQPNVEPLAADEFLRLYRTKFLRDEIPSRHISTAHVLCDIVDDTATATSHVLAQYGISSHSIMSIIRELADRCEGLQSQIQNNQEAGSIYNKKMYPA